MASEHIHFVTGRLAEPALRNPNYFARVLRRRPDSNY
jgi:hypothetical protein